MVVFHSDTDSNTSEFYCQKHKEILKNVNCPKCVLEKRLQNHSFVEILTPEERNKYRL